MNKIKLLGILILINFATVQLTVFSKEKSEKNNVKITNSFKNNKKYDAYKVKNYELQQVVKVDNSEILTYNHKKSNAKVVLVKNNDVIKKTTREIVSPYVMNNINMFFKYDSAATATLTNVFGKLINEDLYENCKDKLKKFELEDMFYFIKNKNYDNFKNGNKNYGTFIYLNRYTNDSMNVLLEELNKPKFLTNSKMLNENLDRIKISLENEEFTYKLSTNKAKSYLKERFIFAPTPNFKLSDELEKFRDIRYLKNQYRKIINPSNFLLTIEELSNPNFKEIMEKFDKEYFSKYSYKNTKPKEVKRRLKDEPFREIEVKSLDNLTKNTNEYESYLTKNIKYAARIYWDISKLPLEARNIFLLKSNSIFKMLQKEIKDMGYSFVSVVGDGKSAYFDKLFCIDIKGKNKNKFKKEVLETNAKKIIKMFYEKFKDLKDEDVVLKYNPKFDSQHYAKSFSLTNNPFSEKYYVIKDGLIKEDFEYILATYKKHKDKFKEIYCKNPDYIDVLKTNNKIKEKTNNIMFLDVHNPLIFKKNKDFLVVKNIAENLITDVFLEPNLYKTGLVSKNNFFPSIDGIKKENLGKVKKYIFGEFKNEIKDFKPTVEQFNKFKNEHIKHLEYYFKNNKKNKKIVENILNNPKLFEKYVKTLKAQMLKANKRDKLLIKDKKEELKLLANLKDENKKHYEMLKRSMIDWEKNIKKIEKNKNNEKYFIDAAKKNLNAFFDELEHPKNKESAKEMLEYSKQIKKLTYENFVKYLKEYKFSENLIVLEAGR